MGKWILAIFCMSAVTMGCNRKMNSVEYTYQYNVNGCDTGRKSFGSKAEMCSALKSDSANGFCARGLRSDRYQADCGGSMSLYGTPQTFDVRNEMVGPGDDFSYQYLSNGCDTGRHTFSDRAALCAALMDDGLNNNCAVEIRSDDYVQRCQ